MKTIDLLKKAEAFQNLTKDQLKKFETFCEEVVYKKGERIFAEGEPSHHVWVLAEGKVDLKDESDDNKDSFGPQEIHFVSETSLFGWSCFVPPYQYYLSGYCDSDICRLLRIKKEDLISLFEADVRIGHTVMSYVLKVVGTHFQQFRDELASRQTVGLKQVPEEPKSGKKTTSDKAKKNGKKSKEAEEIAKTLLAIGKLTHEEIAAATGLDLKKIKGLNKK